MHELTLAHEAFANEKIEARALVGIPVLSYTKVETLPNEERREQEDRRRSIERLKIRVEEAGGSGEDVRIEYKDAVEREAFLAKELEDLSKSAAGLHELIKDLEDELSKSFNDGLHKVNASFSEFFALMFGGGSAKLVLEELSAPGQEDEDDESEYEEAVPARLKRKAGIEISVALPKKRVQSLMQLSGGERASLR